MVTIIIKVTSTQLYKFLGIRVHLGGKKEGKERYLCSTEAPAATSKEVCFVRTNGEELELLKPILCEFMAYCRL